MAEESGKQLNSVESTPKMAEEKNSVDSASEVFVQPDHLEAFFPYLKFKELLVCSEVNCLWRAKANENHLWRKLCFTDFPAVEGSSASKVMTPTSGAKDLYRRLHQNWCYRPDLDPNDVDVLLDISYKGSPIFSECLPYSKNTMLHCFPERLSLGDYVGVHKPPLSHGNLLHAMQTNPLQNHLQVEERQKIEEYVGALSVSLLALQKVNGKIYRLLEGQASIVSCPDDYSAEDDNLEKDLGPSVVPLVVKETHEVGVVERLRVAFYVYADLLSTGGKPALNRLELVDYSFSIWCSDVNNFNNLNLNLNSKSSKHGLNQLQRVNWV